MVVGEVANTKSNYAAFLVHHSWVIFRMRQDEASFCDILAHELRIETLPAAGRPRGLDSFA